jgi:hypothetical protein
VRRTAVVAAAVALALVPGVANARVARPVIKPAVTITALSQSCGAGGYDYVELTLTANTAGEYDIWQSGDSGRLWESYVDLAVGETTTVDWSPGYPQQVDVTVTDGNGRTVASRSVPSPSSCAAPWL